MRIPVETLEKARDVHSEVPSVRVRLDRVGSFGLKVPVSLDGFLILAEADAWVSLPASRRGVDLSRQVQAIYSLSDPPREPEDLARRSAKLLMDSLPYAGSSGVSIKFEVPLLDSHMSYRAEVSAVTSAGSEVNSTRVELMGMTSCPCTMELIKAYMSLNREEATLIATHTQRSLGIIEVSLKGEHLDRRKLAQVVERSMSSPLMTLTKRPDEASLVVNSLRNPKLAEDVVRDMVLLFLKEFPSVPDEATLLAAVRSLESVHMHDIYAEVRSTVGKLRAELT
ncbi:MAG: GTP cyclohydrolase MptA [Candidatus Korarchaeum sp.]|nr:GTP cyclohydrolase MptA [Candidatus Korarchaeum sp.]MDW8036003.1 GTP cyclohydrolase MptA [Candidatus Korarchaeum sp.]